MSQRPSTLPTSRPPTSAATSTPAPTRAPTRGAGKLKVLPEEPVEVPASNDSFRTAGEDPDSSDDDEGEEADDGDDAEYTRLALAQIPAGSARRDAMRLTRSQKAKLPRVTAYTTATAYRLPLVLEHLESRRASHGTSPIQFDEVLYTPYRTSAARSTPAAVVADLITLDHEPSSELQGLPKKKKKPRFAVDSELSGDEEEATPTRSKVDIFIFEYGVVVLWGCTSAEEERRFLSTLKRFEIERLAPEDQEVEELNYYFASYSRIYNDCIALKKKSSYMTKLSLSHALAQSVKLSFFEACVASTIEQTKDIPRSLAETGRIRMPRQEINRSIGRLFILRVNISLVGSMLESPELFWALPDLQPLYTAFREYLEVPVRLSIVQGRVETLQDMLRLLKESVNSSHGEGLERIVIALIGVEILLGLLTIGVDLFT